MFYETQLTWIQHLQHLFPPWLFLWLNFFDSQLFYVTLIALVYFFTSVATGLRFAFIALLCNCTIMLTKQFFALPRPCTLEPALGLISCNSFGFPSGAAASSMLFGLLLSYYVKHPLVRRLAVLYPLLIGFSRIYFGMHFVTDVVGGFVIGALLFLVYLSFLPQIEKGLSKISLPSLTIAFHLLALAGVLFVTKSFLLTYLMIAASFSLGIFLSSHFKLFLHPHERLYKKALLAFIGCLGMFVIFYTIPLHKPFLAYPICLWVSFGSLLMFRLFVWNTPLP